jgi:DNA-binding transcriptional regulator YiaG
MIRKLVLPRDVMPDRATAGEVIAARRLLELTQPEFAAEVGVSEYTVWRWEKGQRRVSRSHTRALRALVERT